MKCLHDPMKQPSRSEDDLLREIKADLIEPGEIVEAAGKSPLLPAPLWRPSVSFQILGDFPEQVRRLDNAVRPHILEAVHGLVWSVHSQFPANVSRVPVWEALEVFLRRNRSSPRVLNA